MTILKQVCSALHGIASDESTIQWYESQADAIRLLPRTVESVDELNHLDLCIENHRHSIAKYRAHTMALIKRQNKGGITRLLAAGNPAVTELTMAVIGEMA